MKKIVTLFIITILLTSCNMIPTAEPTMSDADMATRVAQILTVMPTATGQAAADATATPGLPTIAPTDAAVPTATLEVMLPAPTQEPTAEPTATLAPTEAPTATAQPTATAVFTPPPDDPNLKLGTASWTDDFDNGNNWPLGADKYTGMDVRDGAMRFTGLTTTDGWRLTWPELADFYIEMTVRVDNCTGSDRYGVIARVPNAKEPDRGYLYGFTCDGKFSLRRWNASIGTKGEMVNLVNWTENANINKGPNQVNRLGLMAVGDRLILYANGKLLTEVKDNTFPKGYFGVFVGARETDDFTVRIDQIRYWENPRP